jgi:uncharacterized protein involved in cysteine biosynthesis
MCFWAAPSAPVRTLVNQEQVQLLCWHALQRWDAAGHSILVLLPLLVLLALLGLLLTSCGVCWRRTTWISKIHSENPQWHAPLQPCR